MESDVVVVEIFPSTAHARVAASLLQAEGIPAAVSADDAGGWYPFLQETMGVRLLVPARWAEDAKRVLRESRIRLWEPDTED
jgi:hypothetical protein